MNEPLEIKFGTDGWRAVIAGDFTFKNVERVAQAYADYLRQTLQSTPGNLATRPFEERVKVAEEEHQPLTVVGFDRRFLSEAFAERAAEVIYANGFRVASFKQSVPTPLVSWAVKELDAIGGVVITASHNPPEFNGFKIKASWGGSATPKQTSIVESLIDLNAPRRSAVSDGSEELLERATASYRKQISSYVDLERLRRAKDAIVVDPMHGAADRWVESFLNGGNLSVETIRANRDPLFGGVNPEPIDNNLGPLKDRVLISKALLGLATDGDADRVGAVNERGETMTMHDVVPILLLHLARNRLMSGAVVRTFSQSVLLKRIAAAHNFRLYQTPIGFKYIAELMLENDILIGAEESGGIGVRGHIPERDGILNSLLLLEAVITSGKPPSVILKALHDEFGEFHFGRRDLHIAVQVGQELVVDLAASPPSEFGGYEVKDVETLDGTKLVFGDESWILFRQSGTEPVLRIYSEATSIAKMNALLSAGVGLANHKSQ